VTRGKDHRLALGRLGALVEQLEALVRSGRQVILVTSGGVSVGRQKLMQQRVLNSSPLEMQMQNDGPASMASEALCSLNGSNFPPPPPTPKKLSIPARFYRKESLTVGQCSAAREQAPPPKHGLSFVWAQNASPSTGVIIYLRGLMSLSMPKLDTCLAHTAVSCVIPIPSEVCTSYYARSRGKRQAPRSCWHWEHAQGGCHGKAAVQ